VRAKCVSSWLARRKTIDRESDQRKPLILDLAGHGLEHLGMPARQRVFRVCFTFVSGRF
jgi:hypothetical protein